MNVPRIVGFLILITTLMIGIGSNLASMIDPPSLILVIGSILGMLLLGKHNLGGMGSSGTRFNRRVEKPQRPRIHRPRSGHRPAEYAVCAAAGVCSVPWLAVRTGEKPSRAGAGGRASRASGTSGARILHRHDRRRLWRAHRFFHDRLRRTRCVS